MFSGHLISLCGGDLNCPARSSDLTPQDFCGHLKSEVLKHCLKVLEELKVVILEEIVPIQPNLL